MFFIVGLGNPGAEYEGTRHNLGFMLVDLLAREAGAQVKRRDCRALVGRAEIEGTRVELVKPQTYMNLSGETVACLLAKQEAKNAAQDLIVISDDLALPFGTIRLRRRGSAGGHRSEEHTSELQSRQYLVCRLLLEKKKKYNAYYNSTVSR